MQSYCCPWPIARRRRRKNKIEPTNNNDSNAIITKTSPIEIENELDKIPRRLILSVPELSSDNNKQTTLMKKSTSSQSIDKRSHNIFASIGHLHHNRQSKQKHDNHPIPVKRAKSLNLGALVKSLSPLLHPRRAVQLTASQRRLVASGRLSVWIGTYNVNGKVPPKDLSLWLQDINNAQTLSYDIIVFGTQECGQSIEKSVIFPSKELWEQRVLEYLKPMDYEMLKSETLVALHQIVFVRSELKPLITGVQTGSIATGIGNVIGNKGAVAIGLSFGDKLSLLFLNSHFTAHQSKIQERNADYRRVCSDLPIKGYRGTSNLIKHLGKKSRDVTERFDLVFWSGDLNYRINGTRKMVDNLLANGMLEVLLANDQLRLEMRRQKVFMGFNEADIQFRPTFKFNVLQSSSKHTSSSTSLRHSATAAKVDEDSGDESDDVLAESNSGDGNITAAELTVVPPKQKASSQRSLTLSGQNSDTWTQSYDTSVKQRIPSWTDRILFKSNSANLTVHADSYDSCMNLCLSDHRPVYGVFTVHGVDWYYIIAHSHRSAKP